MVINAAFVHTNIISSDWKKLSEFYIRVFQCKPVIPERHLEGAWIDKLTGIKGAVIRGIHLRLPGYGDSGPTLEIFQYNTQPDKEHCDINKPGFAHIAFTVDDVHKAVDTVIHYGGTLLGEIVTHEIKGAGMITLAYMRDPEGNILELQKWD